MSTNGETNVKLSFFEKSFKIMKDHLSLLKFRL